MENNIVLYEKLKLIERKESDINGAWKGAHLLLFFLAFVFGSFCTFCFHMLMYLFDEKCVLYPKLLSLTTLRQNIIYDFMPYDTDELDMLPVDFVSTQWVEKSVCYLPTYVPLVSGIFGLVWTTLFLMCLTGSRVLTGLQKSWRILPSVFLFSLAMGSLCVYTSAVTSYGLQELCKKLGEVTGNPSCTFTVNVATLAYERRIRGVYQAVKLTMATSWLHTFCWLLSALLTIARVLLAVDFQLVKVSAHLKGNMEQILEQQEHQVVTVSPANTVYSDSHNSLKLKPERKMHVTVTGKTPVKYNSKITQISNNRDDNSIKTLSAVQSKTGTRFIGNLLLNIADNAVTLSEYLKIHRVPVSKKSTQSEVELNTEVLNKNASDYYKQINLSDETLNEGIIHSEPIINTEVDETIKTNSKQNLLQTVTKDKIQIESQTSVLPSTSDKVDYEKEILNKEHQTQKDKQE